MPWRQEGPVRRLFVFMCVVLVFQTIGFGLGLSIVNDKADRQELSAEREARLDQDCASRVDARLVLRGVIEQAYAPSPGTDPALVDLLLLRRDAALAKAPALRCETKAGIPIPVPITG